MNSSDLAEQLADRLERHANTMISIAKSFDLPPQPEHLEDLRLVQEFRKRSMPPRLTPE